MPTPTASDFFEKLLMPGAELLDETHSVATLVMAWLPMITLASPVIGLCRSFVPAIVRAFLL